MPPAFEAKFDGEGVRVPVQTVFSWIECPWPYSLDLCIPKLSVVSSLEALSFHVMHMLRVY